MTFCIILELLHQQSRCHSIHTHCCVRLYYPLDKCWLRVTGRSWASCQPDSLACLKKKSPWAFWISKVEATLLSQGVSRHPLDMIGGKKSDGICEPLRRYDKWQCSKDKCGWSQIIWGSEKGWRKGGWFFFGLPLTVLTCGICAWQRQNRRTVTNTWVENRLCSSCYCCPSSLSLGETGFRQTWQGETTSLWRIPMHLWLSSQEWQLGNSWDVAKQLRLCKNISIIFVLLWHRIYHPLVVKSLYLLTQCRISLIKCNRSLQERERRFI